MNIDHKILLRRHIGELELNHFRRLQDPGEFISDFVKFFSRCQDELVTPDDYERFVAGLRKKHEAGKKSLESDALQIAEDEVARQEELARVYRVSERLLRERNLLTFGEQLMHAVQMLRDDASLLAQMHEQYRYILVDEFQDTNIAQLELLWLLAGERRNIVAVGDDDQAIYRFRGASFGSFTIFLKRFCGVTDAKLGPATKKFLVSLSQNYRSTQRILRVAGEVIAAQRKIATAASQSADHRKSRRRENSHRGIRHARRRSALGRFRNRAAARGGRPLAQLRRAVSQTHAPGKTGG